MMFAQYMQAPTKEVPVSKRIRQTHRWLSIIFTATVIANFVAMALGEPPAWVVYSPLPPLFLMLVTGLYIRAAVSTQAARGSVSAMTRKSGKVAKKTLAKRDAAKTPRKAVPNPTEQPKLLSGGNPQIAKGYGDAPVQAYIAGDAG
jgi:hypothetical protein